MAMPPIGESSVKRAGLSYMKKRGFCNIKGKSCTVVSSVAVSMRT